MNKTPIEWVKNPDGTQGYTWNPITGCLNGCEYCYARKLANGRLRSRYLANLNISIYNSILKDGESLDGYSSDPFYPRFWPERLNEAVKCKVPYFSQEGRGIFVCDMSDLFGIGIPEEWTRQVMNEIRYCERRGIPNRFYLLTKQPQNLPAWSPFPNNCWVGVTATNTEFLYQSLFHLADIKAKIRYLSIEPLLNWSLEGKSFNGLVGALKLCIDWVIIGSQTKPYKPPKIEWVREIVEACDKAGIPVFLKENLRQLFAKENNVHPNMVELRQELPG